MSQSAIEGILDQIKGLSEQDREVLESRWAALVDEEWRREAEKARVLARERGLDQEKIDQAMHQLRYGS